jgi:LemA protein
MGLIIALVVIALIIFFIIGLYNSLVQLRVRADSAWSDIDIQLKRRHDLIPNIVETVKGYAAHEKGTFENIAKWRSAAMSATSPGEISAAENQLTGAMRQLFAVAEAYPQLRASEQFTSLTQSLQEVEDALQNARRYYNAVVRDYNTRLQSFPANMFAAMLGFQPKQFFELSSPQERETPQVKF